MADRSGTPHGRLQRAIERGSLLDAEAAARERGQLSLADALDFLLLLARSSGRQFGGMLGSRWRRRAA